MPETLATTPDTEIRKATSASLEKRADLLRAEHLNLESFVLLLAELGRLAPPLPSSGSAAFAPGSLN